MSNPWSAPSLQTMPCRRLERFNAGLAGYVVGAAGRGARRGYLGRWTLCASASRRVTDVEPFGHLHDSRQRDIAEGVWFMRLFRQRGVGEGLVPGAAWASDRG